MMTIHQMRIFVMVYQNRNITKAAQCLNMTQPAVSRSIAELEAFYKVRLFERINHRIQPTELAGRVYAQAMQIVDSFNQMEKGLKHWDEEGTLRIGASITLGNFLLPDLVARFRKTRPNLTVKVSIANASRIEQDLLEGKLDVAMVEGVADEEHLHKETFSKDHLVPIFPVGHPLHKTALAPGRTESRADIAPGKRQRRPNIPRPHLRHSRDARGTALGKHQHASAHQGGGKGHRHFVPPRMVGGGRRRKRTYRHTPARGRTIAPRTLPRLAQRQVSHPGYDGISRFVQDRQVALNLERKSLVLGLFGSLKISSGLPCSSIFPSAI